MQRILIKDAKKYPEEIIMIQGRIKRIRCHGSLSFIDLADRSECIQVVYEGDLMNSCKEEAVISLKGKVIIEKRAYRGVEMHVEKDGIEILSQAVADLPFEIKRASEDVSPDIVYDHRALSLRNQKLSAVFKIQSEILSAFREFLIKNEFIEISSPKLVHSGTEGGTDLFEVEYFEQKAYLAQSPQFYKQMMVSSYFERVFETAKAYRAEKHDTSRHINEYMSLDFEMSYIEDHHDLMELENRLLQYIIEELEVNCKKGFEILGMEIPELTIKIPEITFKDAKKVLEEEYQKVLVKNIDPEGERLLSKWAKEKYDSDFLFITDFPKSKRPFYTMCYQEDSETTKSFDLLFRGLEVTTGGQRIHLYDQLIEAMEEKQLVPAEYESYLDIFKYAMPPHGGLAIGLERLTKQLCGLDNIREATLFPRDRNRLVP
ncbi:aspartate--tRNA(Asn) ligase [Natronospora cellulosivora (SeqCode)]